MNNRGILQWLTVDMIIFVVANVVIIFFFYDRLTGISTIGPFQLLVLGLASYRAANIVSTEAITKPLRAPFVDEVEKGGEKVEKPKKYGFLGATGLLIYCPSCTGVWLSAALVYLYLFFPAPTFLIALILTLSAIERIISNTLGWFKRDS